MINTNKIGIVLSFFALWINSNFSNSNQQIIGFVVIFLFGILHGSNDLAIITKINDEINNLSYQKILIYYITVVLLGIVLFYSVPSIALLLFILFSGYHFGEQHWNFLKKETFANSLVVFQTIYGLFVLFLLFYLQEEEVKTIVSQIVHFSINSINFKFILILLGLLLVFSGFYISSKFSDFKKHVVSNIFYLLVFAIIFKTASLIWAFAIYFVIWHSVPSIKEQVNYLYGNFNLKNFFVYFRSAFPYWIVSLVGIFLLYYLFQDSEIFNALFFSFLAAITFPHTIIILKMQSKSKKTASN